VNDHFPERISSATESSHIARQLNSLTMRAYGSRTIANEKGTNFSGGVWYGSQSKPGATA
jgi:hypothetical protein